MSAVREALFRIEEASRVLGHEAPCLLAVSKGQPIEKMIEAYEEGQRDFGENYLQELEGKASLFREKKLHEVRWHFIGHLQTNKVKALLEIPGLVSVHSVDTLKLAEALSKRASETTRTRPLEIFLEVNIDIEPSKSGFNPALVLGAAESISRLPGLSLQGLMCIPRPAPDGNPCAAFARLRALEGSLGPLSKRKLSMGMSADFDGAIAEGATHIRLGTALFGPRGN